MDKYEIEKLIEEALGGFSVTNFQFNKDKDEASFNCGNLHYFTVFSQEGDTFKVKNTFLKTSSGGHYTHPSGSAVLIKICIEKQIQINSLEKLLNNKKEEK